jgi:hypothetical protein
MPKLFIPPLGTELTLAEDWTFNLHYEYRNVTLLEHLGVNCDVLRRRYHYSYNKPIKVSIPAGEILTVDRLFIRKGASDFESVTFLWKGKKTEKKVETRHGTAFPADGEGKPRNFTYEATRPARAVRFWAKLVDANCIVTT